MERAVSMQSDKYWNRRGAEIPTAPETVYRRRVGGRAHWEWSKSWTSKCLFWQIDTAQRMSGSRSRVESPASTVTWLPKQAVLSVKGGKAP